MPLDNYFTSAWSCGKRVKARATVAAKHRLTWPKHTKYQKRMALEIRQGDADWFHVIDVPEGVAKDEMQAWRASNPGWEFRVRSKADLQAAA